MRQLVTWEQGRMKAAGSGEAGCWKRSLGIRVQNLVRSLLPSRDHNASLPDPYGCPSGVGFAAVNSEQHGFAFAVNSITSTRV